VEIEVLGGRHSAAASRLTRVMANSQLTDSFRTVGLFYQVWLSYMNAPAATPASLLDRWRTAVGRVRARRAEVTWIFRGARGALQAQETPKPASAEAVKQLLAMLDEMEKRS
jgi:hypothetical protein